MERSAARTFAERALKGGGIQRKLRRVFGSANGRVRFVIDDVDTAGLFKPQIDTAANERAVKIGDELQLAFGSQRHGGTPPKIAVLKHRRQLQCLLRMRARLPGEHLMHARTE